MGLDSCPVLVVLRLREGPDLFLLPLIVMSAASPADRWISLNPHDDGGEGQYFKIHQTLRPVPLFKAGITFRGGSCSEELPVLCLHRSASVAPGPNTPSRRLNEDKRLADWMQRDCLFVRSSLQRFPFRHQSGRKRITSAQIHLCSRTAPVSGVTPPPAA